MYTILLFVFINVALFLSGWPNRRIDVVTDGQLPRSYTDCLRGLAMTMIIFGHVCGRYHESVWFSPFACTGVALFLLLSGYGNNESFVLHNKFPLSKLLKIAIPYWLFYFVLVLFRQIDFDQFDLLLNISFIKTDYWFVGYLFKWYLIYWLTVTYLYRFRWIVFLFFSVLSFVYLSPLESEQSFSFITGVFLSERKTIVLSSNKRSIRFTFLILLFATTALAVKQLPQIRNDELALRFTELFIKLPYAWCIVTFLKYISWLKTNPILVFLSSMTYELYLVHMVFLDVINISSTIQVILTTIAFFSLSIVVALLFKRINRLYIKRL